MLTFARLGDHYRYAKQYESAGIPIFAPFLTDKRKAQFGGFKVSAFELPHGETKSYGFYIRHESFGQLCFLTDFEFCGFSFKDLQIEHLMIEANYDVSLLDMDAPNFRHKVEGHCSSDTCIDFIKHNYSPHTRTISILHTNPVSLDEKSVVERIRTLVDDDVIVGVCHPGYEIELKKEVL